ncbi:uracil-DNA glycosylase [Enterococcus alcedinis]|uniref:Uracil-DNA glycosylase n=1 Tax=Enterococcus alcedinis TaxID=1274384 RepID=A0A917JDZ0_9ENTE|nr:uracil-DNA glycosylase [Enterococcus alcedinis]MBP2101922.1 uracil-DNA glycosylase [Enterococcus alcedinis]GGI65485.1 uracil-DNA glycosylase [Enterococcus alcedinis]
MKPWSQYSWQRLLADEFEKEYFQDLFKFIDQEYEETTVYPPKELIFSAFEHTPYEEVKVVILGQDPYHGANQSHGLAFSVQKGVKIPPSLRNMYKELASDLNIPPASHGNLISWADQGVLLLNTVLTVREGEAYSHRKQGWEQFTDRVIEVLNAREEPIIFVLWGKPAQQKAAMIDTQKHVIIQSFHPSPLSASRGFFGSKPFSKVNDALKKLGKEPIDWQIPEEM